MRRQLQGKYITISTAVDKASAFVPTPLPLITLLLCAQSVLRESMLYLSLYFKMHRQYYVEF
jgi:hypothetical protein